MKKQIAVSILFFFQVVHIFAQDTLPDFNLYLRKDGFAEISWKNDYGIVKQITIQRSFDSLKNYISIASMPNTMAKKDYYLDKKATAKNYFYRIYIQLPEGKIIITKPKKPAFPIVKIIEINQINKPNNITDTVKQEKIKPFVPSEYVFTDKKNNVLLVLPDAENKNYRIVFYDKNKNEILQIPRVKEPNLILEKYNFMRSGWYYFELFENNISIEKNKFLISKD